MLHDFIYLDDGLYVFLMETDTYFNFFHKTLPKTDCRHPFEKAGVYIWMCVWTVI